eukprot:jgi/Mesvir1/12255/Mv00471-RA.1
MSIPPWRPPRSIVFWGDGLLPLSRAGDADDATLASTSHLDALARSGCSGSLALREERLKCSGNAREDERVAKELTQILGVYGRETTDSAGRAQLKSISERFKGMRAILATNSPAAACVAMSAGLAVSQLDLESPINCLNEDIVPYFSVSSKMVISAYAGQPGGHESDGETKTEASGLPNPAHFASRALRLLGLQPRDGGCACPPFSPASADLDLFDLMIVHINVSSLLCRHAMARNDSGAALADASCNRSCHHARQMAISWLDRVAGILAPHYMQAPEGASAGAQGPPHGEQMDVGGLPGDSSIPCPLLSVLLFGYGTLYSSADEQDLAARGMGGATLPCSGPDASPTGTPAAVQSEGAEAQQQTLLARPLQTSLRSASDVNFVPGEVRGHHPLLAVYCCEGLTRRDDVRALGEEAAWRTGGNGTILADHFLAELAFKMDKAPKYGA